MSINNETQLPTYMLASGYLAINIEQFSFFDKEDKNTKGEVERLKALDVIARATNSPLLPAYNDPIHMDHLITSTSDYGTVNVPHPMHLLRALTSNFQYFEEKYGILDSFVMLTLQMSHIFKLKDVIMYEWESDYGLGKYYSDAGGWLTDENEAVYLLQCHMFLEIETWFQSLYIKYGVADVNSLSAHELCMQDLTKLARQCCEKFALSPERIEFTNILFDDEELTLVVSELESEGKISVDAFCDVKHIDEELNPKDGETPEEWVGRLRKSMRKDDDVEHTWEDVDKAMIKFGIPARASWSDYAKEYTLEEIMSSERAFANDWYLQEVNLESQVVDENGLTPEFASALQDEDFVTAHFAEGEKESILMKLDMLSPIVVKHSEELGPYLIKAYNHFESVLEQLVHGVTVAVPEPTNEGIKTMEGKSKLYHLLSDLNDLVEDVKPLDLQMAKPTAKGEEMVATYVPACGEEKFKEIVKLTSTIFATLESYGISTALSVPRKKSLTRLGFFLDRLYTDEDYLPLDRGVVFTEEGTSEDVTETLLKEPKEKEEMTTLEKRLKSIEDKLDALLEMKLVTKGDLEEMTLTFNDLLSTKLMAKKEEKKEDTGYLDESVEKAIDIPEQEFLDALKDVALVKEYSSVKIKANSELVIPAEIQELCDSNDITLPRCTEGNIFKEELFITPVLLKGSKNGVEKAVNFTGVVYCDGIYVLYINSYSVVYSLDDGAIYSILDLRGRHGSLHMNCNRYPSQNEMFEHFKMIKTFAAIVTGCVITPKEFIDKCDSSTYTPKPTVEVYTPTEANKAECVNAYAKLELTESICKGHEFIAPSVASEFDLPKKLHSLGKKLGIREYTVAVSNFADDTYLARISHSKHSWLTGYALGDGVTMIVSDGYIIAIQQGDDEPITTHEYAESVGKAVLGSKSFDGRDSIIKFLDKVKTAHDIMGAPVSGKAIANSIFYEEAKVIDLQPLEDTTEIDAPFKTVEEVSSLEEYECNVRFIRNYESGAMPCSEKSAKPYYEAVKSYEAIHGKPVEDEYEKPVTRELPASMEEAVGLTAEAINKAPTNEVQPFGQELMNQNRYTNPKDDPQFDQKLALGFYTEADVANGLDPLAYLNTPTKPADDNTVLQQLAGLLKPVKTAEEIMLEKLQQVMAQGEPADPTALLLANMQQQQTTEQQATALLQQLSTMQLTPEQQIAMLLQQSPQNDYRTPASALMKG